MTYEAIMAEYFAERARAADLARLIMELHDAQQRFPVVVPAAEAGHSTTADAGSPTSHHPSSPIRV